VYSREEGAPKRYVQDELLDNQKTIAEFLKDPNTHIYICGLKAMEDGVEGALSEIAKTAELQWSGHRDAMREDGRYHVETY